MILSDKQKETINKNLSSKMDLHCPMCNSKEEFFISEVPTQIISFSSTGKEVDFSKVSYIHCLCVHCMNCGYILQFRLDKLGIKLE